MATRKELREMRKALSIVEEVVRQKTLQILRNTSNKEQAASMIARQVFQIVRQEMEPLRKEMIHFRDESIAQEMELLREREELKRKTKAELARIDRETQTELARLELEMKEENENGEEWKRGGAPNN